MVLSRLVGAIAQPSVEADAQKSRAPLNFDVELNRLVGCDVVEPWGDACLARFSWSSFNQAVCGLRFLRVSGETKCQYDPGIEFRRTLSRSLIVTETRRDSIWQPDASAPSKVVRVAENEDHVSCLAFRSPNEIVTVGHPKTGTDIAKQLRVTNVESGQEVSRIVTKKELRSTLTDRLSAEGLKVVDGAPAVLSLQYAEGRATLSISKFQPGVPRSQQQQQQPTGPGLESTRALMQLALKINNKAVWTKVIELDPRFMIIRGDATAQSARDNVFEHV